MVSPAGKIRAIFLAVMLAVAASVAGLTNQASADTTTQLNASQIVAEMGAGWNLGNQMEANSNGCPSETAWGQPTITQALIDKVKSAGFKTIRIPVSYLRHIGPGPDYTINAAWLNRIQEVVNYAYNRGLYVLINMHGDGYKTIYGSWLICDSSNQTAIRAKYQKVWQQIATRFQNYDQRLILESMNENFDGQFGRPTQPCYSNINSYKPSKWVHRRTSRPLVPRPLARDGAPLSAAVRLADLHGELRRPTNRVGGPGRPALR